MIKANNSVNITKLHRDLYKYILELEDILGEELVITSGYRGPDHPIEAAKSNGPGVHSRGVAVDVAAVGGTKTLEITRAALGAGFERIGISRKKNFIHLDIADKTEMRVKSIWTY